MLFFFYFLQEFYVNEFFFMFQYGEWKDVEYVVFDGKFEGYLNGVQVIKWLMGMLLVYVMYFFLLF